MFRTNIVERIKINILHSIFFFENRAFYEIMSKNTVEPCRPQMTIRRMRITYWIPKATHTHTHTHTHTQNTLHLLFFYCNNGCPKRPKCSIIHILPVLL